MFQGQGIQEAGKHLSQMAELLPSVKKTLNLGITPHDANEETHGMHILLPPF